MNHLLGFLKTPGKPHDLRHILLHAGDGGELMLDAGDLDAGGSVPGRDESIMRRSALPRVVP